MEYIKLFATEAEQNAFRQSSDYAEPHVSWCEDMEEVKYNKTAEEWANEYFTTIAREDGTISFNIRFDMGTNYITSISYSTDNGETWNTTNNVDNKSEHLVTDVSVERGDKILWKGTATQFGCWSSDEEIDDLVGSSFSSTCEIDVQGNVMSLLYGDNFKDKTVFENEYTFTYLFSDYDRSTGCLIVNAQNLLLPATTLTYGCYSSMFRYCSNLITVPELPATILAEFCYQYMFDGCTSLVSAPELPALTLADNCYSTMFCDCTNLTSAPELPATVLANNCYYSMFYKCTSLTVAPELPAMSLEDGCYAYMFSNCTNLTTSPELPATTLAEDCYYYMFANCESLTIAPELPATVLEDGCYTGMFSGCASLINAPELPATTLAYSCYSGMFRNCTSLQKAPELPATTLAGSCYSFMFQGCTSLTVAPELPATTLATGCYWNMFNGCTNLNYIKAMFTTTPSSAYTGNWVYGVASTGIFIKNSNATWTTTGVHGVPSGWTVQDERYTPDIWEDIYLTFDILSNGTINWTDQGITRTISYKLNNGEWTNITASNAGATINVSTGDKVMFKGDNTTYGGHNEEDGGSIWCGFYNSTASFNIQGNIMSLINGDSFANATTLPFDNTFVGLFENTNVVNAENLILPATTLTSECYKCMFASCTSLITTPELPATSLTAYCYKDMFNQCTSLTTSPELPATTLEWGCYEGMFQNCTSLTTAPELLATMLTYNCYSSMFDGCTSLTVAPELPAMSLEDGCYAYMFSNCTSLITAPELPATTLKESCYEGMFQNCISLATAPELPATTLATGCYWNMFNGCTNLNYIKAMFTTTPSDTYTSNWVSGVAANGTFVKNSAATWNVTGNNGIPTGWTVQTASE